MRRKRPERTNSTMRLRGVERVLFILGALVYLVGLFGGMHMLDLTSSVATLLLAVGEGLLLIVNLVVLF